MNNLDISAIDDGIILCYNQATQLIMDGDLLLEHGRYPTAFSLYQLASEESSKIKILLRLAIEKKSGIVLIDDDRGKDFEKMFNSHVAKIKLAAKTDQNFNELALKLRIPKIRSEAAIQEELENPKLLNLMKQDGLYVGLMDNKFIPPSQVIGEIDCKKLREDVVFRHSRHKETMEYYFQHTDFFVKQFVDEFMKNRSKENKASE